MDYIDNLTLAILLHLHRTPKLRLFANDYNTLMQLQTYIGCIDALFKNKPENLSIEEDELFEENYKPCITCKTFSTIIDVFCDDTDRLESYLKNYINAYNNEDLIEHGDKNEYITIAELNAELRATGETSNRRSKHHIIKGIRYAPVITEKYLKNNNFIKDMEIKLVSPEVIEYPIKMYMYTESGDIENTYNKWQEYFDCRFEIDMAWYLNTFSDNSTADKLVQETNKYPKQQQTMLNVLEHWVNIQHTNQIPANILISRAKILYANIDSAVSRLNKQYKQINNTDEKLLTKHKGTGFYEISSVYIENIQTNG